MTTRHFRSFSKIKADSLVPFTWPIYKTQLPQRVFPWPRQITEGQALILPTSNKQLIIICLLSYKYPAQI